jgi:hypothetical protein
MVGRQQQGCHMSHDILQHIKQIHEAYQQMHAALLLHRSGSLCIITPCLFFQWPYFGN